MHINRLSKCRECCRIWFPPWQQHPQPESSGRPVSRWVHRRCGGMAVLCRLQRTAASQAVPAAVGRHHGYSGCRCGLLRQAACSSSFFSYSSWLAMAWPLWMKVSTTHLDVGYIALFSELGSFPSPPPPPPRSCHPSQAAPGHPRH